MNALNPFSIYRRASVERWEVKDNKKKRWAKGACWPCLLDFFDSIVGFSWYSQLLRLHIYYDQNWVWNISEIIPKKYISRAYNILENTKKGECM
jgi:hypothetical protein